MEHSVMEPFTLSSFSYGGISINSVSPITFTPKYDEDFNGYVVAIDEIDLFCFGETKAKLIQCILEFVLYDWTEYVLCPESDLDDASIELRKKLQSMFIQLP